ncbi:MAG: AAA family ATPase [Isosphaeraceae bacterium]
MLERVKITNFRSLVSVDVPLKPLTVLIGKNDSGKSTFLKALLVLTRARQTNVYDLPRHDPRREGRVEGFSKGAAAWIKVATTGVLNGGDLSGIAPAQIYQVPVQGAPMTSDGYDDPHLAEPLKPDGGDVPSLLDYLLRRDRERFFGFVDSLKSHVPGVKDVWIATPNRAMRDLVLVLESGFQLRAEEASAGVRLIIFFIALAFHPTPTKLILIEEPETGIHPRRLEDVVRLLRQITRGEHGAEPAQIILTTHSPYLLDYMNPTEDQVLVFKREDDGSCTAKPVDTERLKDFLSEFMLGEVWYNQGEEGLVKQ